MKARIFIVSLISICCTVFWGCSDENDFEEVTIQVESELGSTFDGHGEVFHYMKAKVLPYNEESRSMSITHIIGFQYEEGYTYVLRIRIEPIIYEDIVSPEAPRKRYILIEEIQKEKAVDTIMDNDIQLDKELIQQLKTKAVDTLKIEPNSFVLEAYLWRDFQPESPPNGQPMISINRLIDVNSVKTPDNISMVKQYVIYQDSIWISDYENEMAPSQPEYKIEKVSRNGPEWGPKVYVDVISQIYDSNTDKTHYIALKNAFIERTD